jgi:Holliday junction resolvasome RuvABC ATP-dependent DNA helicase subunit
MKFKNYLPSVIGQESAKKKLNFLLAGMERTGYLPHLFLSAEAGGGKSFISKEIARATANIQQSRTGNRRIFTHVNAGQVTSMADFGAFMFETVGDKESTVLIDEAHGLSEKVTARLLSMLEPSNENKGFFAIGAGESEQRMEVDFSKVTFIFATTERDKMFPALLDRLKEIQLAPLSEEELAMIILSQCNSEVEITTDALVQLVGRLRLNGRSAIKMGEDVNSYVGAYGVDKFGKEDAEELFEVLGIHPLGVSDEEIRVLKYLRAHSGVRLQDVANHMNQSPQVVKEMEKYLTRRGLMAVDGKRFITMAGREYLENFS